MNKSRNLNELRKINYLNELAQTNELKEELDFYFKEIRKRLVDILLEDEKRGNFIKEKDKKELGINQSCSQEYIKEFVQSSVLYSHINTEKFKNSILFHIKGTRKKCIQTLIEEEGYNLFESNKLNV